LGGDRHTVRMSTPYNRFSGLDRSRLAALSDGVFAVAMTLLVLDLHVPSEVAHSDRRLLDELRHLGPPLSAYLLSFTMLGTFWLAQHTLMTLCERTDRTFAWWQLGFLFMVTLLPFSASLLAEYVSVAVAVWVYWLNLLLLGVTLGLGAWHLRRAGLVEESERPKLAIFRRRIVVAQIGYALAALIAIGNTYASVIALAVVQLYFILSPRVPLIDRLLQPGT
jgi:uncharacterized membrane protein